MRLFKILIGVAIQFAVAQAAWSDACMDRSQTQADMNRCANAALGQADRELNRIYRRILTEYADDPVFIGKFKAAQRAWLQFRDAEMAALFPPRRDSTYYGSAHPMCHSQWLETLTKERIAQLKKWSDKTIEGDMCAGSIKSRP